MTLNATFVVQVLNFFGAWCLVKYLFIKPALKIRDTVFGALHRMHHERTITQNALQLIGEQEARIWHQWALCVHRTMKERYRMPACQAPASLRVVTPEVPAHEIERLAQQLTTLVLKRVQESS